MMMTSDLPTKDNPAPLSSPTGLAARLAARQVWVQRSIAPWIRFVQTIVNRRPQIQPDRMLTAAQPQVDRDTPLILAGEAVRETERTPDWLKTMPSFEEVRRSFEAARETPPFESALPTSGADGLTRIQRQPAQSGGPSPSADSAKSLSTFEKLRQAVEMTRAGEASSGDERADQSPAEPQQSSGSRPAARSRRVVSRVEEVSSQTEAKPPAPDTVQLAKKPDGVEPRAEIIQSVEEPADVDPESETVQLAKEPTDVDPEASGSPKPRTGSTREPKPGLSEKKIATATDPLLPRLDEAPEAEGQPNQFAAQVEMNKATEEHPKRVSISKSSPPEVEEPPAPSTNLTEDVGIEPAEPPVDVEPTSLRQPAKTLVQTAAKPSAEMSEAAEDRAEPEPTEQTSRPAAPTQRISLPDLEKSMQPSKEFSIPAESLETMGIEPSLVEQPDIGPTKKRFEIPAEKLESEIHSDPKLPAENMKPQSHSEFSKQLFPQETHPPDQKATDQPQPPSLQRKPEASRSGQPRPDQMADLDLGQEILSKATAILKTPIFTPPSASEPKRASQGEIQRASDMREEERRPTTGLDRAIEGRGPGETTRPTEMMVGQSVQPLPLAVQPALQPDPRPDRPSIEPIRKPPARSTAPEEPGLQRQVDPTMPGAAAAETGVETVEQAVEQGISHLADQAADETENLNQLAREIYPIVKRMLAIERERSAFY